MLSNHLSLISIRCAWNLLPFIYSFEQKKPFDKFVAIVGITNAFSNIKQIYNGKNSIQGYFCYFKLITFMQSPSNKRIFITTGMVQNNFKCQMLAMKLSKNLIGLLLHIILIIAYIITLIIAPTNLLFTNKISKLFSNIIQVWRVANLIKFQIFQFSSFFFWNFDKSMMLN